MTYNKPQITLLGNAESVIQGSKVPPRNITDQPTMLTEVGGIYDTEE
jgi:hypothetical protein